MKIIGSTLYIVTVLFMTTGLIFLLGGSGPIYILSRIILCGFLAWGLPWAAKRVNTKVWDFSGLFIVIGLLVPTSSLMAHREPGPVSALIQTTLFLLPSLAIVGAALLLYSGLVLYFSANDDSQARPVRPKQLALISLILSIILIVKMLHNLYELTVWDNTYDPIEYLWLILPICAVLLSAFMLSVTLPGKTKLAGMIYLLLIPGLMITVSALAQRVDFRQETMKRAERTVHAIESYYAREGYYPEDLSQLTPRYILSLPKPMIIYGQEWCYASGDNYYRLGYVDREHWSDPRLIGRIYKAKGEIPDLHLMCKDEITAVQAHDPDYPYTYWKESE
jgi:hypothetical protein